MSVDKFKFVSPGIFIDEIDESAIPRLPERMGPLVVGRFQKGPAHLPVKVNSFAEFAAIFGYPAAGTASGDIWRTGELTAPTYAAYAVQAWLRNNSPCTVYRVLGQNPSDANSGQPARAGWITDATPDATNQDIAVAGGAYGLFIMPNPDSYEPGAGLYGGAYDALDTTNVGDDGDAGPSLDQTFTFNVPTAVGGTGTNTTIFLDLDKNTHAVEGSGSANQIGMGIDATGDADVATHLINAINGVASGGRVAFSTATTEGSLGVGVQGITAKAGSSANKITVTADKRGAVGNNTTITYGAGGVSSLVALTALTGASGPAVTGTLAAVWYLQEGAVVLTGTARDGVGRQGAGVLIKNSGTDSTSFTAKILDKTNTVVKEAKFNFSRDSKAFIRKAFNTDPTKTNLETVYTGAGTSLQTYWLGETFESNLYSAENGKLKVTGSTPSSSDSLGVIMQLAAGTPGDIDWHDHLKVAQAAKTGWFISQDNRGDVTAGFDPTQHTDPLFRFVALGGSGATSDPGCGETTNRDIKISITAIKAPTDGYNKFGTFSVTVRKASDTDNRPLILERFSNVNLNPASANFIKRVVGDRHYSYNNTTKLVTEQGEYENRSKYIRVEVSTAVDEGQAEGWLPFGVYGPAVPKTWTLLSGSTNASPYCLGSGSLPIASLPDYLKIGVASSPFAADHMVYNSSAMTASIEFPTSRLRVSSSEGGLILGSKAYFGYQSNVKGKKRFDHTNLDLLRSSPSGHDPFTAPGSQSEAQYSWVFTLDDVKQSPDDADHSVHVSGSRALGDVDGGSWTAKSGSVQGVLSAGYNKFTSPMFGGFDGFDITEKDPLRNTFIDAGKDKTNYAYYSLKKAIDMTADKEYVEFDVAVMPGVTNSSLNSALVDACENRADALAIIDLAGNYQPPHEHALAATHLDVAGSVDDVVTELDGLSINSSYGCTFYPFVKIRDTINDAVLCVPPSVVALGTFSSSQRKSAVWFAPAGFTRGGLSEGSAGLPVIGVKERVVATERDKLYDANINPIATFPAEGIVIFGQKTLQVTQSALDRINVRRLLIYLKKEISRIASRILFDQNVQATWDRFTGQVVPFLEGVKAGLGLTDFKVVLDDTTTTPDLIDRNILYAKIFLKPARAIEFIALDFIITRSGASFDD